MERHVADRIIRTTFNGPPSPCSYSDRLQVYADGYDTDPVPLEDDEAAYVAEVFGRPWCPLCEDFIEEGAVMLTIKRTWGQQVYCERHATERGYGRTGVSTDA